MKAHECKECIEQRLEWGKLKWAGATRAELCVGGYATLRSAYSAEAMEVPRARPVGLHL